MKILQPQVSHNKSDFKRQLSTVEKIVHNINKSTILSGYVPKSFTAQS